jgi:hypothetical protein
MLSGWQWWGLVVGYVDALKKDKETVAMNISV